MLSWDTIVLMVLMLAITAGVRVNGAQWEDSAIHKWVNIPMKDPPHKLKNYQQAFLKKLYKWLLLTYVSLGIKHIIDYHTKTFFSLLCILPRKE